MRIIKKVDQRSHSLTGSYTGKIISKSKRQDSGLAYDLRDDEMGILIDDLTSKKQ
jgi:hypothetical protein